MTPIPQATQLDKTATFIISSWSYPDEYSQGIYGIAIHNNTASIKGIGYSSSDTSVEVTAGDNLTLYVYAALNCTLVGAATSTEGLDFFKLSVTVHNQTGGLVFYGSPDDFMLSTVMAEPPYAAYEMTCWLNFTLESMIIYTLDISYQTYYTEITTHAPSKATSGEGYYSPVNDYTYTWSDLLTDFGGTSPVLESSVIVNFTLPANVLYFDYAINCAGGNDDDAANFSIYDFTNGKWVILNSVSLGLFDWLNDTSIANSDYWSATQLSLMVNSTDGDSSSIASIAYAEVIFYTGTPLWYNTTTATAQIIVGLSSSQEWAINGWYMLIGAFLIIGSSTFISIKVKSRNVSADDVFIFLVAHPIGWALLITAVLS